MTNGHAGDGASVSEPGAGGSGAQRQGGHSLSNLKWQVEWRSGSAAELHARPLEPGRSVEVLEVPAPAFVLGSTQPETDVDDAALRATGIDLVRRRSGGGGVLLLPGRTAWIDVTIGRDDPLWQDDVGAAFEWLGQAWAAAVERFGIEATVHVGKPVETAWSRRVCFAGIGSGEVVAGGRKLVGISQRRTRDAARFQCVVHRAWDPVPLMGLLAVDVHERAAGLLALLDVGAALDVETGQLVSALLATLP